MTVSTFGVLAGLAGVEHGIGEVLQGNVAPDGVMILSWPGSEPWRIVGGEPAMTVVPNLLVTGILAIIVSLVLLVWSAAFVGRRHGGPVLVLLSVVLLLVGGGFGPPLLGTIIGVAATGMNSPHSRWRVSFPAGPRRFLARVWPWSLAACLLSWLMMLPGTVLLSHFLGVNSEGFVYALILSMFGFLFLTIAAGYARDTQRSIEG